MSDSAPERRFADLDALRRQLEEMVSRRNRSDRTAQDRLTDQEPTLIIRGK
jgi:hypothetical protein